MMLSRCLPRPIGFARALVAGALWAVVEITPGTLAHRQLDFFHGGHLSDLVGLDILIRYALPYLASASHGATECEVERGFIEPCIFDHLPYGGAQYRTDGSHGCVHMPLAQIAFLYRWAPIGTPVTIRW